MKFRGYNIMYNKTITITICRAVLGVDQKDFVSIFYILQKLHHFICVILGIIWFGHTALITRCILNLIRNMKEKKKTYLGHSKLIVFTLFGMLFHPTLKSNLNVKHRQWDNRHLVYRDFFVRTQVIFLVT